MTNLTRRTLIDVSILATLQTDKHLRLFDCRSSLLDPAAGLLAYTAGHIDGAQYVDLNRDLSAQIVPGQTGRHPLPDRETFAAQVRRWGITQDSLVVAYDADNGAYAARLWWMLRWLGHPNVVVLDGGYQAWLDAGQVSSTRLINLPESAFFVRPAITRQVAADELQPPQGLLLDARDRPRFEGKTEPIDPVAGHIPGAVCAPFGENLDGATGRFRSAADLRQRFNGLGATTAGDTICYCGSGVTAAHNILAMVHAGFPEPALYPGSWSEWIIDPTRPVTTL
jgi:thiosulfate/3-mercaptopyruvate sulfurtransferase